MSKQLVIGTKALIRRAMTLGEYNLYRGWTMPPNEDPKAEGYLVEYIDGGEANDVRHEGYISWSPKDVCESAYKVSGEMDFGHALMLMKRGFKVARSGWNGTGMYVVLMKGYPEGVMANEETAKVHGLPTGTPVKIRPYFALMTAQDDIATWAPSGSDSLAEDWSIVE